MQLSQRNCAVLLCIMAAVCFELYQAQMSFGRCVCIKTYKDVKANISDFLYYEKKPRCHEPELIVTITKADNSTIQLCLQPQAELGRDLIQCWKRINKTESRKMECIDTKRRNAENQTVVESST